mgnify:FL=1
MRALVEDAYIAAARSEEFRQKAREACFLYQCGMKMGVINLIYSTYDPVLEGTLATLVPLFIFDEERFFIAEGILFDDEKLEKYAEVLKKQQKSRHKQNLLADKLCRQQKKN